MPLNHFDFVSKAHGRMARSDAVPCGRGHRILLTDACQPRRQSPEQADMTMRRILVPIALAAFGTLPLSGCHMINDAILFPRVEQANRQMAAAKIDCDAKFPPMIGSYAAHARCINAAQNWVIRPLSPYPDLLAQGQTARLRLSEQVDRGQLDPGDLARLAAPEDAPLTIDASTRRGPLSRQIGSTYYALPEQIRNSGCSTRYGYSACNN